MSECEGMRPQYLLTICPCHVVEKEDEVLRSLMTTTLLCFFLSLLFLSSAPLAPILHYDWLEPGSHRRGAPAVHACEVCFCTTHMYVCSNGRRRLKIVCLTSLDHTTFRRVSSIIPTLSSVWWCRTRGNGETLNVSFLSSWPSGLHVLTV